MSWYLRWYEIGSDVCKQSNIGAYELCNDSLSTLQKLFNKPNDFLFLSPVKVEQHQLNHFQLVYDIPLDLTKYDYYVGHAYCVYRPYLTDRSVGYPRQTSKKFKDVLE